MFTERSRGRLIVMALTAFAILVGFGAGPDVSAAGKPSLQVVAPTDGATINTTDIPVTVKVSDFVVSTEHVGMPDKEGEGHIHVMLDGLGMGVLFNFYTTPSFTLPGTGIQPGPHTLVFDLATNTHMDLEDTAVRVKINYQPTAPQPAPAPALVNGPASLRLLSPADGATVGPQFTIQVEPTNFTPALQLEGKPNLAGYGHYHVFVDMPPMSPSGGMMSMAGMVGMPGSSTIPMDLSAWPSGQHTITVEAVQNDHSPVPEAKPVVFTINLQNGTTGSPFAGDNYVRLLVLALLLIVLVVAAGVFLRRRSGQRA